MRLRREVVDLVGLNLLHDADEVGCVGEIAVVEEEAHRLFVTILIEMIYPVGVEERRTPLDAVHGVSFSEKKLGQIGAVLPGNAGDKSRFSRHRLLLLPLMVKRL